MAATKQEQRSASALNLLHVDDSVYTVYGTTATKLTRPVGKTGIVLMAHVGDWTFRNGDHVVSGMPAAFNPSTANTGGTAGVPLFERTYVTLQAADYITVKGFTTTSALTYYWL